MIARAPVDVDSVHEEGCTRWPRTASDAFRDASYAAALERPAPRPWLFWIIEAVEALSWAGGVALLIWLAWAALSAPGPR